MIKKTTSPLYLLLMLSFSMNASYCFKNISVTKLGKNVSLPFKNTNLINAHSLHELNLKDNVRVINSEGALGLVSDYYTNLKATVKVYSVLGTEVYKQENFVITTTTKFIPLVVKPGVYIVKIVSKDYGSLVQKVIF
ncbi:T9SS type A sorting domain-containing protein [Aquimarina agarivorans]|uniref:T9SS type A sorting domain-containing protein n=1 Tax=Aquimarina agarivorans TaxID=980584 RepID=UPI000248F2CE|nr:T9SS type A sorting domain-containing protein [Aquimarina agarivorans]